MCQAQSSETLLIMSLTMIPYNLSKEMGIFMHTPPHTHNFPNKETGAESKDISHSRSLASRWQRIQVSLFLIQGSFSSTCLSFYEMP